MSIGTAGYMSPEQASGERALDARTDVYSLGCVLYEMLAGEAPFTGPNAQAILARSMTEGPRAIHPIRPGVPESIDQVIARAVAIAPADRYASAGEFAAGIRQGTQQSLATATRVEAPRQRVPVAAVFIFGILIGVGALFAWRYSSGTHPSSADSIQALAVLPFENQGPAEQEYFADGMTDEIRGKLAELKGLRVIASASSRQYKNSDKLPQEIAKELGVQFLLTGTVRWERGTAGGNKVRVSPELVDVAGVAPSTRWQQAFEVVISDVFKVQADVAGHVAQALNVSLGTAGAQQLNEAPTRNLQAYDLFLRGQASTGSDPSSLRRAVDLYEQAVALDSTFAEAWYQLSRALTILYNNSGRREGLRERAKAVVDKLLQLDSASSLGHAAAASYYTIIAPDIERAGREINEALAESPNDANVLSLAGPLAARRGEHERALDYLRQAVRLDPRSYLANVRLADHLLWLRRYADAAAQNEIVLGLLPNDLGAYEARALIRVLQGDLPGARASLRAVPPEVSGPELIAYVANYWDCYWLLDDEQLEILFRLSPAAFNDERDTWAGVLAQAWWYKGNVSKARAYADTAAVEIRKGLAANPNDAQLHTFLGLMLAILGRKRDAAIESERGISLAVHDARNKPYHEHVFARALVIAGDYERAIDMLEQLLAVPYLISRASLKVDPNFAALRGNPRFERMIAGPP
jgi:serine/threonine-protein kinase